MKEKIVLVSIVGFLILLIAGGYFVYHSFSSESLVSEEDATLGNKSDSTISEGKSANASTPNGINAKGSNSNNSKSGGVADRSGNNSKQIKGSKNQSSGEPVIDQTLHAMSVKDEKGNVVEVLGSVKEKINIDIFLFDAEQGKALANYDLELKYKYNNDSQRTESFKSDAQGKFVFPTTQTGFLNFQIFTKDFSIHSKNMMVRYGKNEYKANLYKGGTIEVHATNMDNKLVEGLAAKFSNGFRGRQSQDLLPLEIDAAKQVYLLPNVPAGTQEVSFKASGYVETPIYKVLIEPKNVTTLDLKLQKARVLYFDLDIKSKPDLIYISNRKLTRGRGRNVFQTEGLNGNGFNDVAGMQTTWNQNGRNRQNETQSGGNQSDGATGGNNNRQNGGQNGRNRQRGGGRGPTNFTNFNSDKTEVFKNEQGLFEYELEERNTTSLTLMVDKYIPLELNLVPDKDTYKVTLVEGYIGELQINNEKGEVVSGATVNYSAGSLRNYVISGDDGIAQLTGLSESMVLRLNISHKDYVTYNENWSYSSNEQNNKIIVLAEGAGISGKIKFGDKPVMGAKVQLFQTGNNNALMRFDTEVDGSYYFNNLDSKTEKEYRVEAFHREFGAGSTAPFKFTSGKANYDLTLAEEKSLNLKLVDNKGVPLPNKNITIMNGIDSEFSLSVLTDDKGECKFVNLIHGYYYIRLEDDMLRIKSRNIQIPAGDVTMTAEEKDLKKIIVTKPDGSLYKGTLKVSIEVNRNGWPIEVITGDDGYYYLESREDRPMRFGTFLFEAHGYAPVRLGPYEKAENMPKEFEVNLVEGENFKVKVVDDRDDKPIPYISVDITFGNSKIQSLPTNDLGEIIFTHLSGKFNVVVKDENFASYSNEFDGAVTKEMIVRLIRGGGLKGHLTVGKDVSAVWVSLQPGNINMPLDSDGNFEFYNILPGEYELTVSRNLKDGKNQMEKIPVRIVIENEKTFEINLDDFQKNQTTLDISVYRDGALSNENGFLNITDRRGQSVVAAAITNGKYLVERILPGEYLLSYNYQGKALQKTLGVLPRQSNVVDIFVPGSSLTITVKNEEGAIIPKAMITLYAGEKYRQEDTFLGNQLVTAGNGVGTFLLMPKAPYYLVVEEDFRFNYQVNVIGPIILEAGQASSMEYILPYAKKIPKIQVTDNAGNPLADTGFIFNDDHGNFFQRTLKKEWDLFPYSNKNGFLPENCWPKTNFTLIVGKEGYEFREVAISADFDPQQLLQIKLNKASSIKCNFPKALTLPVSVGILNKNGVLLQKPIPLSNRNKNELTVYFENISFGNVQFKDLAAGEYYIGYFWNGSSRLISRQGPLKLGVEENLVVTSTLQVSEY